ncbi:MAG: DUF2267 domain-containing protein [Pseudomonadota bacterium]
MQELINRVVDRLGLDANIAEKCISIILNFLKTEVPAENINPVLEAIPGTHELLSKFKGTVENSDTGGDFLTGALGNLMGGNGVLDTLSKLQAEGLDMEQARSLGQEIFNFAQETVGADMIDEVKKSIPGLNQVL